MKKITLFIYILALIFLPIKIFAAEIIDTEITGTTEKNIGEYLSLDFKINFEGIEKGSNKTLGIWLSKYELIFDEEVLVINEIISNDFKSYVYKEDNKYYVISEVIENNNGDSICSNNILYCGDYEATIKFYIKNTELTETTVKIGEIEVGLLDMDDTDKTYTLDDLIKLTNTEEKKHTLKINKSTTEIQEVPKDISTEVKPTIKEEKNIKIDENIPPTSAFIKDLKIKNYKIDFEKNKTNYNIILQEDINELDIDITLENENATYKVIGADDLKGNNNEIAIVVTSENNNTITYTINVKYKELIKENTNDKKIDLKEIIEKYLTKDNLTYAGIVLGIIIIIILIILLINKKENKKINKLLGEL